MKGCCFFSPCAASFLSCIPVQLPLLCFALLHYSILYILYARYAPSTRYILYIRFYTSLSRYRTKAIEYTTETETQPVLFCSGFVVDTILSTHDPSTESTFQRGMRKSTFSRGLPMIRCDSRNRRLLSPPGSALSARQVIHLGGDMSSFFSFFFLLLRFSTAWTLDTGLLRYFSSAHRTHYTVETRAYPFWR